MNGKQLTLIFYIDNILLAHISSAMVIECTKKLDEVHGLLDYLTVTRRKLHKYLGMSLNFGTVEKACAIA